MTLDKQRAFLIWVTSVWTLLRVSMDPNFTRNTSTTRVFRHTCYGPSNAISSTYNIGRVTMHLEGEISDEKRERPVFPQSHYIRLLGIIWCHRHSRVVLQEDLFFLFFGSWKGKYCLFTMPPLVVSRKELNLWLLQTWICLKFPFSSTWPIFFVHPWRKHTVYCGLIKAIGRRICPS